MRPRSRARRCPSSAASLASTSSPSEEPVGCRATPSFAACACSQVCLESDVLLKAGRLADSGDGADESDRARTLLWRELPPLLTDRGSHDRGDDDVEPSCASANSAGASDGNVRIARRAR